MAPLEAVSLCPVGVGGLAAFVDFRFGAMEYEPDIQVRSLFLQQAHALTIFDAGLVVITLSTTE